MERNCPHCERAFEATATKCPYCGEESPPWKMHEGRWWQQREGRWWIRNEATHVWKPFGGGGGVEPETVDAWAILEVLKQQTGFLRRIAFWATLFGVVWLIGTAIWVVSIVGIVSEFG